MSATFAAMEQAKEAKGAEGIARRQAAPVLVPAK
jgi:hypothetical protein